MQKSRSPSFSFAHSLKFHRRLQLTHGSSFQVWYVWSVECSLNRFPSVYSWEVLFISIIIIITLVIALVLNCRKYFQFIASLQCRAEISTSLEFHHKGPPSIKVLWQSVFLFVAVNVHFSRPLLLSQSALGHYMIRQSYTLGKNG